MRRVVGLLAAVGLISSLLPATVAAGQPFQDSASMTGIRCELPSDAGFVSLFVEVTQAGGFADMALWLPGSEPFEELPDIATAQGTASLEGSILLADFELLSVEKPTNPEDPPTFEPAGRASLRAELSPIGEPRDLSWDDVRDGNVWVRNGLWDQLLAVEGALTLDLLDGTDAEIGLADCGASTITQTLFVTNPNAYVLDGDQLSMSCSWVSERGSIELLAVNDTFGTTFSQVIMVQGDRIFVGLGVPSFSDTTYQAGYEVFDPTVSRDIIGSASADASLSPSGERINDHEWVDGIRFSLTGDRLAVDGTLSISVEGSTTVVAMDDASCQATDLRVKVIEKIGRG